MERLLLGLLCALAGYEGRGIGASGKRAGARKEMGREGEFFFFLIASISSCLFGSFPSVRNRSAFRTGPWLLFRAATPERARERRRRARHDGTTAASAAGEERRRREKEEGAASGVDNADDNVDRERKKEASFASSSPLLEACYRASLNSEALSLSRSTAARRQHERGAMERKA